MRQSAALTDPGHRSAEPTDPGHRPAEPTDPEYRPAEPTDPEYRPGEPTDPGHPPDLDDRRDRPRRSPSRVVVLCGPSGAGKSRLATRLSRRHGWPVVRLDDFYREAGDPRLPMLDHGMDGLPDWDDPGSWDRPAAVAALETLARTGFVDVPDYDIASSRRVGHHPIAAPRGSWIVAEGIFAAHVIADLREQDLLAAACCIRNNRWLTFWRRLLRDLRERRKPPLVLWRRGLRLARAEPRIVAGQQALGAAALTGHRAERLIERLSCAPSATR